MTEADASNSVQSGNQPAPKGKTHAGQSILELGLAWGVGKSDSPHSMRAESAQLKSILGGLEVVQDEPEPQPQSLDQTRG